MLKTKMLTWAVEFVIIVSWPVLLFCRWVSCTASIAAIIKFLLHSYWAADVGCSKLGVFACCSSITSLCVFALCCTQVPLLLKDMHIEMRTLGAELLAVFTRVQSQVDCQLDAIQVHVPQVRYTASNTRGHSVDCSSCSICCSPEGKLFLSSIMYQ
jgi:hypothetical protein